MSRLFAAVVKNRRPPDCKEAERADALVRERRTQSNRRYLLLCRHGPHRKGTLTPVQTDDRGEEYPIDVVAETLYEQRREQEIHLVKLWCAPTPESEATMARLRRILYPRGTSLTTECKADLAAPPPLTRNWPFVEKLRHAVKDKDEAVLVVGNQPSLSLLADALLNHRRWRVFSRRQPPTPIDRADVVCIALARRLWRRDYGRLLWTISYADKEAAEQVREKIKRKMDIAKLLSGALTFGLTAIFGVLLKRDQLNSLGDDKWAVQLALGLLLLAAILYFATMAAYDSLLMPQRFWGEQRATRGGRLRFGWLVARPPSSAAWVLYQNMMRVWRNLFTVATACTAAGIGLLAYGALRLPLIVTLIALAALLLGTGAWIWWSRPALGSQD